MRYRTRVDGAPASFHRIESVSHTKVACVLQLLGIPVNSDRRSGVFGHPAVRSEVAKRPTSV